ncbi:MAG: hypothetical protein J1E83_13660 [Lachnospiraceae bacterium]|nr:hypothetical protein [Lachnospiraceae bacterium]
MRVYGFRKWKSDLKYKLVNLRKIIKETIKTITITLITTIAATIIATALIDMKKEENSNIAKQEKLLYDLQTICIGCNKEWMDYAFGMPVFTNIDGITKEEVYITDIALIRAFFGIEDNACKMFFITQTSEEPIPFMPTISNTYYNTFGEEEKLGILSYDEIKYSSIELFTAYGFFTNGSGRVFYGEGYHSYAGYYYDIYFASLDYGENNPWNMMGYIENPDFTEEEIAYYKNLDFENKLNKYKKFLSQRSIHYPNTYGVSSLDSDYTFDKLMDYNTFDSIQTAYR